LSDTDYRLLGKGLKFCERPKPQNDIQLKEDIFQFSRKPRLKEYFGDKGDYDAETEQVHNI
jgi:hypothetical protein